MNTASVHYHIGTKRDLVAAIIDTRTDELGEQRAKFLEVIESMLRPSVRKIAEAMVLPAAERTAKRGGRSYVGFLAAVGTHPDYADMVSELTDKHAVRLVEAYAKAAPTVPEGVRAFRYALAKVMINQAYGQLGVGVRLWVDRHAPGGDVDFTERLIDAIAGLLRAPSSV